MVKNIQQRYDSMFTSGGVLSFGVIAGIKSDGRLTDNDYFTVTKLNTTTVRVQPGYAMGSDGEIIYLSALTNVSIPDVEGHYYLYVEYDEEKSLTGYENAFPGGTMTPDTIYPLLNDSAQLTVGTVDAARDTSKVAIAYIYVNSSGEIASNSSTITSGETTVDDDSGDLSLSGALANYDSNTPYLLVGNEYIEVSESGGVYTIVSRGGYNTVPDHHHFENVASTVVWSPIIDIRHYNKATINTGEISQLIQLHRGIVNIDELGVNYLFYHTDRLTANQARRLYTLSNNLVINLDDGEGDKMVLAEKIPSMPNAINTNTITVEITPDDYDIADKVYEDIKLREISISNRSRYQGKSSTIQEIINKVNKLQLWSEKVTNGDFSADVNWTKGTGWTISGGNASHSGGDGDLEQDILVASSTKYRLTFNVSGYTGGTLTPEIGGTEGSVITANGTYEQDITTVGTGNLKFKATDSLGCNIDDVNVKKYNDLTSRIDDAETSGAISSSEADNLLSYILGEESDFIDDANDYKDIFDDQVATESEVIEGLEDSIYEESEKINEGTPFVTGKMDIHWDEPALIDNEKIIGYRVKSYAVVKTFSETQESLITLGATDPYNFEDKIAEDQILQKLDEKHTDYKRKTVIDDPGHPLGKSYTWNTVVNERNIQYKVSAEMRFVIYIASISEYGVVGDWCNPYVINIPAVIVQPDPEIIFSDWVDERATLRRMRKGIEDAKIKRQTEDDITQIRNDVNGKAGISEVERIVASEIQQTQDMVTDIFGDVPDECLISGPTLINNNNEFTITFNAISVVGNYQIEYMWFRPDTILDDPVDWDNPQEDIQTLMSTQNTLRGINLPVGDSKYDSDGITKLVYRGRFGNTTKNTNWSDTKNYTIHAPDNPTLAELKAAIVEDEDFADLVGRTMKVSKTFVDAEESE